MKLENVFINLATLEDHKENLKSGNEFVLGVKKNGVLVVVKTGFIPSVINYFKGISTDEKKVNTAKFKTFEFARDKKEFKVMADKVSQVTKEFQTLASRTTELARVTAECNQLAAYLAKLEKEYANLHPQADEAKPATADEAKPANSDATASTDSDPAKAEEVTSENNKAKPATELKHQLANLILLEKQKSLAEGDKKDLVLGVTRDGRLKQVKTGFASSVKNLMKGVSTDEKKVGKISDETMKFVNTNSEFKTVASYLGQYNATTLAAQNFKFEKTYSNFILLSLV